jgi:hypothetical protein
MFKAAQTCGKVTCSLSSWLEQKERKGMQNFMGKIAKAETDM